MGKLAQIKTRQTDSSVQTFIDGISDDRKRNDCIVLLTMMKKAAKEDPKMWGSSMIGFGKKIYTSPATGREVEWFRFGFSPRKANISLHLVVNVKEHASLLKKLGKHKTGVGCLYIKTLSDIDTAVLEQLIAYAAKKK